MLPLPSAAQCELTAHGDLTAWDNPLLLRESAAPPLRRSAWVEWVTFDPLSPLGRHCSRSQAWLPAAPAAWERRIEEYLRATAATAPETPLEDAEGFLQWLADSAEEVGERRSVEAAREQGPTVELAALRQRLAHARFQQVWRASLRHLPHLSPSSRLMARLNPIHVWAILGPPRAEEETGVEPIDVLFYPVGEEVRSVRLGFDAATVLRRLERGGRSVRRLVRSAPGLTPRAGVELLRQLCQVGAIALG